MLDPAGRKRLAQLLAMGSSAHDGELANALRLADRLVRQHQLTWDQILLHDGEAHPGLVQQLQHQLTITTDACKQLQIENERLRHDLSRAAKAAANGAGHALLLRDHSRKAQWIIELDEAGAIALSAFEREFCETIAGWTSELTEKQQPVFVRILRNVCRSTGRSPP